MTDIELLKGMMERAGIKLPLAYRPNEYDDWGYLRDKDGKTVCVLSYDRDEDTLAEHRRAKTDPAQPVADLFLHIFNHLLAERERLVAKVASLRDAAEHAQKTLALLVEPKAIEASSSMTAWAHCVASEAKLRAALGQTRP